MSERADIARLASSFSSLRDNQVKGGPSAVLC